MVYKIYGNKNVLDTFDNMVEKKRVSQAFLLYGEHGLGKKAMALYMASKICNTNHPLTHADITLVNHSGKTQGFSVEDLRQICVDAYVMPNTSDSKVYILTDCDNISIQAQDVMLKIIEEPPEHVYFIFTVSDRSMFLRTILSRVISLPMIECSEAEVREALLGKYRNEDIESGIEAFGGNIGLIKEYIESSELKENIRVVREITECIIKKNEYELLKVLKVIQDDRAGFKRVLMMFIKVVRDSAALKLSDIENISCYKKGSLHLGEVYSIRKLQAIHELIKKTTEESDSNVSLQMLCADFCSRMMQI